MQYKLPVKHLIRQSGKLLLLFVLAALIIGTTNEADIPAILTRALLTLLLFALMFFSNIAVLIYYDNRRKNTSEKISRKVFLTGYAIAIVIVVGFHFLNRYLQENGLIHFPEDRNITARMEGWRMYLFFPYIGLIIYSFVFLIQNFIVHQYEKNSIEMELLKLKAINTETVNQLLRQQIQPHFLFNALNVLKSLIKKYPQTAEAYLIRLSDFLRASVTRNTSGLATVREELKLCDDYMEMQKIRFGKALLYEVQISPTDDCMDRYLPFFALQPLLENAIKHNELTTAYPLTITTRRNGDFIIVSNNLQVKQTIEDSTGNGLANLRERYRMFSGDDIFVTKNESEFSVSIKILGNEPHPD